MLVPSFHKMYWMGLNTTDDTWPTYRWLDPYVPALGSKRGFKNWGTVLSDDGSFSQEPANPGNLCAGASAAMKRGSPPSWGWAGEDCNVERVFICRVQGERTAYN